MQNPAKASETVVEETSIPESLTAAQVSISATIVTNLTDEILNSSEVYRVYNNLCNCQSWEA